jgi:hypothetical protein
MATNNRMMVQQAIIKLENWIAEKNKSGIKLDSVFLSHLEKGIQLKKSNWIPNAIQNTYLKEFEIPQIILFDLLTKKFPLVTACQQIAEKAFLEKAASYSEICILDIGIGRGFQMMGLLEALQQVTSIKKVTLIGVEISEDALNFTSSQLQQQKSNYKFDFQFHLINMPVESITYEMIKAHILVSCNSLFVNASLTLHHIQQLNSRLNLFNIIRKLNPQLMILIEPDADTMNEEYENRLLNAAEHFSALYNYVNTLDCMNTEEAYHLKSFFANDFIDPVVLPDTHRFERLQTSSQWIDLLASAGLKTWRFEPSEYKLHIPNIDCKIMEEGYFNLSYCGTPLISVMALRT